MCIIRVKDLGWLGDRQNRRALGIRVRQDKDLREAISEEEWRQREDLLQQVEGEWRVAEAILKSSRSSREHLADDSLWVLGTFDEGSDDEAEEEEEVLDNPVIFME